MRLTTSSARRTAAAAASIVVLAGLTACGTGSAPGAGSDGAAPELSEEEVTLRATWWGGDSRHPLTQKAIDAFEEKYPNIDVVGEFADWGGYWDKLATQTAGGNAPDIMQMDELYLASYADRGALYDLERTAQLDTSGLDPKVLDLGRSEGTLYGMPISTTAFGILANQDLLDELGLELPDTSTWTWEDLSDFATEVSEKSGGEVVGISALNNGYSLQLWARQHGEALFSDGSVSISPETLAAYFQQALDWTASGAAAPASHQAEMAGVGLDQTDFSTGKQALAFSQITQIPAYEAATGGATLEPVKIPSEDANEAKYSYLKPGMYWSVSSTSEHPAEAALFVDFMVNDPEVGGILGTDRGIPSNGAVRDSILDGLAPGEKSAADFVAAEEAYIGEAPEITPNGASELDTLIARYLQDVLFESQTPQEAAEAFIAELDGSIQSANQ
ncbi:ABC transporter substrate-binding protein [Promicromonospora panici]|uniref:ABC transporter substrate-binding protein n=1 Tax=Promicromonospora panici TaxID=2219658 RepID=UPI00101BA270|nr:extracellular solute-binding protein [Promicromonospora panici]